MKASEVSDEGLAAVLRAIAFTSNLLSDEKEYIREAADRLEEKETEDEREDDKKDSGNGSNKGTHEW